jgi:hypothetical protein
MVYKDPTMALLSAPDPNEPEVVLAYVYQLVYLGS